MSRAQVSESRFLSRDDLELRVRNAKAKLHEMLEITENDAEDEALAEHRRLMNNCLRFCDSVVDGIVSFQPPVRKTFRRRLRDVRDILTDNLGDLFERLGWYLHSLRNHRRYYPRYSDDD